MGWHLVGLSFAFRSVFLGGSRIVTWRGTGENASGGILHGHTRVPAISCHRLCFALMSKMRSYNIDRATKC